MALHLGSDCNRFEALLLRISLISPSHFIKIHSSTDVDVTNMFIMFELIVVFPVLHLILSPCYQGMPKWFDSVLHAVHSSRLKLRLLCVLPTCFERFCPFRGWSWRDLFHAKKSTRSAARVDESLLRNACNAWDVPKTLMRQFRQCSRTLLRGAWREPLLLLKGHTLMHTGTHKIP